MSETPTDTTVETPAVTAPTTTAVEPAEPAEPATPDYKAEAEKWKSLSRQNEAQAKANAEKAKRFDEVEEANKTELQKAQDALNAAEAKATEAEQRALRSDISRTTGVPAELLTGTTAEDLTASAETILAFAKAQRPQTAGASGSELAGSGETGLITQEQVDQVGKTNPKQVDKWMREGKLAHLLR